MAALKYTTHPESSHLRIVVTGEFAFQAMLDLVTVFYQETQKAGRSRLLVDCSRMEGKVTEPNKYFIGEKIAMTYGVEIKVALVMPQGTVTKLGEMVAVNRGANFFATDDETEALTWLTA